MRKFQLFLKRAVDVLASAVMLLILTVIPVMIVIPILIRLTSQGPAIYKQIRVGKDGKTFIMYKFRTMITQTVDADGNDIMPENRITRVGRILRKLSLDELPQLINILNGTMSIIGPRPMLDYQALRCIGEENLRFQMRPGLTGLAQVKGRNNILWEERIQYDIEYVRNYTLWLDVAILFKTVVLVFKKEGTAVKPEYRGVSRFSKYYVPETEKQEAEEAKEGVR